MSYGSIDYLIGTGIGINAPQMGMPIAIAGTDGLVSNQQIYPNLALYTSVIDKSSLKDGMVNVYYVGWSLGGASTGLVAVRAKAKLTSPLSINIAISTDVLNLQSGQSHCYDIWTDINKPHLYMDDLGTNHTLVVAVTGRCDGIYRIQINPLEFQRSTFDTYYESATVNKDIFSTAYNSKTHKLFYAFKEYNSDDITIFSYNILTWNPEPAFRKLNSNETIPVLTVDSSKDILYISTTDSDKIYKINGSNIKQDLGIATLPAPLSQVSSVLINGDYLYMVTWEANAQAGRVPISQSFCSKTCGSFGYCVAKPVEQCFCSQGYARDPSKPAFSCITAHELDIIKTVDIDRSLSVTLGVLFALALIAAIAGWFMWWRNRKAVYSSM